MATDPSDAAEKLRAVFDPANPELRETLAHEAYLRERELDAAADREHNLDPDAVYMALAWDSLDEWAKRPFRMGVEAALDHVAQVIAA